GQRAAEHGEVLGEHAHRPAVDGAVPGDHAIAEDPLVLHPEIGAPGGDELGELDEAPLVPQGGDALPGGQLAGRMLPGNPRLAGGEGSPGFHFFQSRERVVALGHDSGVYSGVANVKGSALSSRVLWVQLKYGAAGITRLLPQCSTELRAAIEGGIQKATWYPF